MQSDMSQYNGSIPPESYCLSLSRGKVSSPKWFASQPQIKQNRKIQFLWHILTYWSSISRYVRKMTNLQCIFACILFIFNSINTFKLHEKRTNTCLTAAVYSDHYLLTCKLAQCCLRVFSPGIFPPVTRWASLKQGWKCWITFHLSAMQVVYISDSHLRSSVTVTGSNPVEV